MNIQKEAIQYFTKLKCMFIVLFQELHTKSKPTTNQELKRLLWENLFSPKHNKGAGAFCCRQVD